MCAHFKAGLENRPLALLFYKTANVSAEVSRKKFFINVETFQVGNNFFALPQPIKGQAGEEERGGGGEFWQQVVQTQRSSSGTVCVYALPSHPPLPLNLGRGNFESGGK